MPGRLMFGPPAHCSSDTSMGVTVYDPPKGPLKGKARQLWQALLARDSGLYLTRNLTH